MFRSHPGSFAFDGLESRDRKVSAEPARNSGDPVKAPQTAETKLSDAATLTRLFGRSLNRLRLCVQGEEAHHVMSNREPQQMDAGLDLAAQG
jgi:hypothetical protein